MIPGAVGLLLLAFSCVNAYRVFRRPGQPQAERGRLRDYQGPLGLLVCVLAYPLLLGTVNFLIATFLILFVMLLALGYKRAIGSSVISVGVTLFTYLIFTKVLGVVFPSGPIEHFVYSLF